MEKRVQEIRELEKQATPGPWKQEYDILCLKESKALCYTMAGFASDDDWKLVQALRNNILAVLDDNDRLRAENAQLQRERDAAVGDLMFMCMGSAAPCCVCTYEKRDWQKLFLTDPRCRKCGVSNNYEKWAWRGGPQEVEHG